MANHIPHVHNSERKQFYTSPVLIVSFLLHTANSISCPEAKGKGQYEREKLVGSGD